MLQVVLWALGTGFVTGAVWFAIVLFRRHPTHAAESPVLPEPQQTESMTLETMTRRLLELEERLDATEHLLRREKAEQLRRPPPE
jgi:hypothetical protein